MVINDIQSCPLPNFSTVSPFLIPALDVLPTLLLFIFCQHEFNTQDNLNGDEVKVSEPLASAHGELYFLYLAGAHAHGVDIKLYIIVIHYTKNCL